MGHQRPAGQPRLLGPHLRLVPPLTPRKAHPRLGNPPPRQPPHPRLAQTTGLQVDSNHETTPKNSISSQYGLKVRRRRG